MTYLVFSLIALSISFLEYTRLSSALAGPDLSVAFLGYIIVASSERTVLIRAWGLGLAMDLWSPFTTAWYMFWYLLLAVCFLPLRAWIFQKSYGGWFLWAFILHYCMSSLLSAESQWYADWTRVLFDACATGLCAVAFGALCNELPHKIHPLGGPDAS